MLTLLLQIQDYPQNALRACVCVCVCLHCDFNVQKIQQKKRSRKLKCKNQLPDFPCQRISVKSQKSIWLYRKILLLHLLVRIINFLKGKLVQLHSVLNFLTPLKDPSSPIMHQDSSLTFPGEDLHIFHGSAAGQLAYFLGYRWKCSLTT